MSERDVDITVEIDEAAGGPGYARIVVPSAGSAGEAAKFRIQRQDRNQQNHLGPNGWQNGAVDLLPWRARRDGTELILYIGPEIVDRVPNDISVELSVPDASVYGHVLWPDLPSSSVAPGGSAGGIAPRPAPPPKDIAATARQETGTAAPAETGSGEAPAAEDPPADDPVVPDPMPNPADQDRLEPLDEGAAEATTDQEDSKRSRGLAIFVAGLLVAFAALAVYLAMSPSDSNQEPAEDRPPLPDCDSSHAFATAFLEAYPEEVAAWHDEAVTLIEVDCVDAATLLLLEAVDKGSAEAALYMGRLTDPLEELDDRLLFEDPDAESALYFYGRAAEAGSQEATEALRRLREWMGDADGSDAATE